MAIRIITLADVESLETLDKKCFSDAVRYNRYAFGHYLSIPNSIGLLKESAGSLQGFIISTPITDDTYNLVTIDVDPHWQRRGIGSELVSAVKRILKQWEVKKISLQVAVDNKPAIEFYQKHGFQITEILPKYYPTTDGYQMEYLIGF
ncbi:GNAT family N-acetyltransferase [[Eubacterium] cellulosolvens]